LGKPVRHLMVDKVTTVPKSKVGAHIGRLDDEDILRLNRSRRSRADDGRGKAGETEQSSFRLANSGSWDRRLLLKGPLW
jgi:hypothetical protein